MVCFCFIHWQPEYTGLGRKSSEIFLTIALSHLESNFFKFWLFVAALYGSLKVVPVGGMPLV
jgi:hypothetical protein